MQLLVELSSIDAVSVHYSNGAKTGNYSTNIFGEMELFSNLTVASVRLFTRASASTNYYKRMGIYVVSGYAAY